MRWFKHITLAHDDEKLSSLMDEFGAEGYGVWWLILEKIGKVMDKSDRCSATYSLKVWANSCRISAKKFQNIVRFLEKNSMISSKLEEGKLTIECRNLLKYRDEWTARQKKEEAKTPEQLPSDSRETPATEYRIQNTDTEEKEKINKKEKSAPVATDGDLFANPQAPADAGDVIQKFNVRKFFEEFWKLYPAPKRIGHDKCLQKFKTQAKTEERAREILEGLRKHLANWEHTETQFIPNAHRWLNEQRWQVIIEDNREVRF